MANQVFETMLSSKGQVVISKEIRDRLGLKEKQKFRETVVDGKIVLAPVPSLYSLGGALKDSPLGKKSTEQIMKEIDEGWD